MKTTQTLLIAAILSAGLFAATGANAALFDRGGGLIYDSELNVTWLANANLASTNTFGVSSISTEGGMSWDTAISWIAAMNTSDYLGFNNWRLPTTNDACTTYNCNGSEMGYLFYNELGGTVFESITATHNANYNLFTNITTTYNNSYWSGTEYASNTSNAWVFNFFNGGQGFNDKPFNASYAWAVLPGDVAAVPVPASVWLLGSGLLGLIGVARRKAA